jgi:hypothetical protein
VLCVQGMIINQRMTAQRAAKARARCGKSKVLSTVHDGASRPESARAIARGACGSAPVRACGAFP